MTWSPSWMVALSLLTCGILEAAPPNFILILSDDQDWAGLSVRMDPDEPRSAHPVIRTPNLERLARDGMVFSRAYAPAPVCSPTRASVQTGKTPARLRWTKAAPPVMTGRLLEAEQIKDLPTHETTIAERLKEAGYGTAHFGKWHIGGGGPAAHGYDVSDGDTGNREVESFGPPNPCDVFGTPDRIAAFMEARRGEGRPFYVQWSSYALHAPGQALPETQAACSNRMPGAAPLQVQRAALAENLDTGVGRLLDRLHRLGLESNTYVVYMSDNGAGGGRDRTRLLSAGKGGLQEGGIRVPFIVRGPGVATGAVCRVPIAGWDLFPTFSARSGITNALPTSLDGTDISPLFATGLGTLRRRADALFFHFPHYQGDTPQSAIVQGDYKLIYGYEDDTCRLFDLSEDPGERRDLADTMPDKARSMRDELDRYLRDVGANRPKPNPDYDPARSSAPSRGSDSRPMRRSGQRK